MSEKEAAEAGVQEEIKQVLAIVKIVKRRASALKSKRSFVILTEAVFEALGEVAREKNATIEEAGV